MVNIYELFQYLFTWYSVLPKQADPGSRIVRSASWPKLFTNNTVDILNHKYLISNYI